MSQDKEKQKETAKKYRLLNREKLNETIRKRYWANRERYLAYARKWKQNNKEKMLQYNKDYHQNHIKQISDNHRRFRINHLDEYRKKDRDYGKTIRGRYKAYKSRASRSKMDFHLTFEQFSQYWDQQCFYCKEKINGIGLDRVDNCKGYLINNIVPCCKICNKMKLTMTQDELIIRCKKIIENYGKNSN